MIEKTENELKRPGSISTIGDIALNVDKAY